MHVLTILRLDDDPSLTPCLCRVYKFAVTNSINCVQARIYFEGLGQHQLKTPPAPTSQLLYLLRVFPEMGTRLALIELLQPTLWDPSRLVDVILDMDHPILVPLTKEVTFA